MEQKQTTEKLLDSEAEEVHVSRKFRNQLMEQYLRKGRWRFSEENPDEIESNARLVEWEDGTYGIYVGEQYYEIDGESPGNQLVYTVNDDLMLLQSRVGYSGSIRQNKLPVAI